MPLFFYALRSIIAINNRAKKITGHIMMVDGGRSLTSSGYVKWEGMEMMNRRFEPDSKNLINYYFDKMADFVSVPIMPKKGTEEWLKKKQSSNWATRMEEAHFK